MGQYAKAVVAGIATFAGGVYQSLLDDRITGNEWVAITLATVSAGGLVFGVPNSAGSVTRTPPSQ